MPPRALWTLLLVAGSADVPLPAAAMQDGSEAAASRTPDNAQKFLATVSPDLFSVGKLVMKRDGTVSSPDVCRTSMSGLVGVFDGTRWVVEQTKEISRPGIYLQPKGASQAEIYLELDGLTLTNILPGSPAHQAGFRTGDVIVNVNGKQLGSLNDYFVAVTDRAALGRTVPIMFQRGSRRGVFVFIPVLDRASKTISVPAPAKPPVAMVIDWSKVEQITGLDGSPYFGVELKTPSEIDSPIKTLYYSVANTRDRVLAAAQYLQTACDTTKDLGF